MAASHAPSEFAPATRSRGRVARFLAPVALAMLIGAIVVVVLSSANSSGTRATAGHARVRRLPPYWIVRPGDTFAQISQKTGLSIAQLEAFNPNTDPYTLGPGQRLNLWQHPPAPRRPPPKPLGPRFWLVRPGQSFGSIAAATGINITTLEHLNPHLKPATLQPGDRVRLRH
jgi:LysM repeat protein